MNSGIKRLIVIILSSLVITGCGLQSIPQAKNDVDATFAEINNQYKRRSDLIPNLVATVQGYAGHEKGTLTAVIEARAKATSVTIDPSNMSAQKLAEFQKAQGSLSQALGRLMVVAENYPQLKADRNFSELQAQLEGTENRITVARNRHIEAIKLFNNQVTVPFTSWTNAIMYHYSPMPQWTVDESEIKAIQAAPKVDFGTKK
ncbi:MAG: LemA family protein [Pseudomonadota bacterium]